MADCRSSRPTGYESGSQYQRGPRVSMRKNRSSPAVIAGPGVGVGPMVGPGVAPSPPHPPSASPSSAAAQSSVVRLSIARRIAAETSPSCTRFRNRAHHAPMRRLVDASEHLDGDLGDSRTLDGNLADLARINRLLGGANLSAAALRRLVGVA